MSFTDLSGQSAPSIGRQVTNLPARVPYILRRPCHWLRGRGGLRTKSAYCLHISPPLSKYSRTLLRCDSFGGQQRSERISSKISKFRPKNDVPKFWAILLKSRVYIPYDHCSNSPSSIFYSFIISGDIWRNVEKVPEKRLFSGLVNTCKGQKRFKMTYLNLTQFFFLSYEKTCHGTYFFPASSIFDICRHSRDMLKKHVFAYGDFNAEKQETNKSPWNLDIWVKYLKCYNSETNWHRALRFLLFEMRVRAGGLSELDT